MERGVWMDRVVSDARIGLILGDEQVDSGGGKVRVKVYRHLVCFCSLEISLYEFDTQEEATAFIVEIRRAKSDYLRARDSGR